MELTTLETVPGKTITRHIGLVQGSTVRAKHVGRDVLAGLKNIVGGELKSYTALLAESRNEALTLLERGRREAIVRMKEEARRRGATRIVNVRLETASLSEDFSGRRPMFSAELIAYGTALVPRA